MKSQHSQKSQTSRLALAIAMAAAAALALSACNSDDPGTGTPGYGDDMSPSPTTSITNPGSADGASLMTADSEFGTIVVDGNGMVVYQYDADTQGSGASSCSAGCLANWPPVPGGADAPTLEGITGEVTTITGTDGNPQLALNGWPLYYYAGDTNPGDTAGQAISAVWWVISPAGEPIRGN